MFPIYEGKTCLPGTDPALLANCTQGGYSLYSVNVSNVAQIQLTVNFARSQNLRLLVKNTGHDYNGRSTGSGALSLWTHNLKDIRFISNYETRDYAGPAFKAGAGVQGFELYQAADAHGVTTVSGICPTVGVVGGFIQGGGHSPVMQLFGMGADQALALEAVTAAGEFVTATPYLNSDLYWALLGGGGGTFGIVTSAILKAHPQVPVTTSTFSFATSNNVSAETFWKGFAAYWNQMPAYNAAKTYSYWSIRNAGNGSYVFTMAPFFATNKTVEEYEALVGPFFKVLSELGIPHEATTEYFDSFYPAYQATFGSYPQNIGSYTGLPGNRLVPAENWDNETIRESTLQVFKDTVDRARAVLGYHQAPLAQSENVNSVNPAFRAEASQLIIVTGVGTNATTEELKLAGENLTHAIIGPFKEATPGGGAYNNEADVGEQGWQHAFWGDHYPRLLEIKKKWDPTNLFYVHHGIVKCTAGENYAKHCGILTQYHTYEERVPLVEQKVWPSLPILDEDIGLPENRRETFPPHHETVFEMGSEVEDLGEALEQLVSEFFTTKATYDAMESGWRCDGHDVCARVLQFHECREFALREELREIQERLAEMESEISALEVKFAVRRLRFDATAFGYTGNCNITNLSLKL
ncbi:hypothetical protein SLS64_011407 [Diaporthe eres]